MKREKAAVVYARTLLESADEQKAQQAVSADIQGLAEAFRKEPRLHRFLVNPIIGAEKKAQLLSAAAASFAPLTRKFLKLLETKNRFAILRAICEEYIAQEEARRNIVRATVLSATPLTPDQIEKLSKRLEGGNGKRVVLVNQVDKSLIAGFRILQGDIITDASIKHKLDQLKQKLAA